MFLFFRFFLFSHSPASIFLPFFLPSSFLQPWYLLLTSQNVVTKSHIPAAFSYSTVMEQLKIRMIAGGVQENLVKLFHNTEPSIAEMICSNLERVKVFQYLHLNFILFLETWIFFLRRTPIFWSQMWSFWVAGSPIYCPLSKIQNKIALLRSFYQKFDELPLPIWWVSYQPL